MGVLIKTVLPQCALFPRLLNISMGFLHNHPYEIFIPQGCEKLIIGTLPPPRLSTKQLKPDDVDFCYGSCDNLLWPVLDSIFKLNLLYDNSAKAVRQRKEFLCQKKVGICDIVESCVRQKVNAADLGMEQVVLRDIFSQLGKNQTIHTLLFTGGSSKNGPEYFFRKQAKEYDVSLVLDDDQNPKRHHFIFEGRRIQTISLMSPSNAANRAIGSTKLYKQRKQHNPTYSTFDYRVEQYQKVF